MDAADLDYRARTLPGCIPSSLVTRLLELGHQREAEFQAGRGEWLCAPEWARLPGDRRQHEQALDVLGPYLATGWWPTARARAELLEGWGRAQEAIELSRPYTQAGDRLVLDFFARLMARHGRAAETFALLRPGTEDRFLAQALVDVAKAAGQDEEAAALLETRIEAAVPACDDPHCHRLRLEPSNAFDLLATVRERQGHIDDAIALLRRREVTSVNGRDALADPLARHGRIEELRAYTDSEYHGHAAQSLAEVLEERGDEEGATAVYRTFAEKPHGMWRVGHLLSQLLVRHGAASTRRSRRCAPWRTPRAARTTASLTRCAPCMPSTAVPRRLWPTSTPSRSGATARRNGTSSRYGCRSWPTAACSTKRSSRPGRTPKAAPGTRPGPSHTCPPRPAAPRRAVAVLEQHPGSNNTVLAHHLIDLGRINEAVPLLQVRPSAAPVPAPWDGTYSNEPPF
ncbi:tetratricopeptide repeat protein [Kitasatospora griseola]|uniref:tetratricopeptide repeat protein n=1 Tax=Kitasatospora griseola TaxID=2064 RepID=UPI0036DA8F65